MKLIKYLFPLWIGVIIYTVLSLCFGAKGFSAYRQLESEMEKEVSNIAILSAINAELSESRNMLYNDKTSYSVYARELGFAASGESFIRIIGLGSPPKIPVSPGQAVAPNSPDFVEDRILQILSFFTAFTFFISMVSYDFFKYMKTRESGTRYYRYNYSGNFSG